MGEEWGGAGGLGLQQSHGIQLAGEVVSGITALKGCGWGREGRQGHQGEGVFSMSKVQVFSWRDRKWGD